jgi:hypothetical protein
MNTEVTDAPSRLGGIPPIFGNLPTVRAKDKSNRICPPARLFQRHFRATMIARNPSHPHESQNLVLAVVLLSIAALVVCCASTKRRMMPTPTLYRAESGSGRLSSIRRASVEHPKLSCFLSRIVLPRPILRVSSPSARVAHNRWRSARQSSKWFQVSHGQT